MSSSLLQDSLGVFVPGQALRREGAAQGPLAGLRFAAKDLFDVAGSVTGCGNPDWAASHGPAEADAWGVSQALAAKGAMPAQVARTNDEIRIALSCAELKAIASHSLQRG